ncbi:hypothetical protein Q9295_03945 [Xinfangfangia sp. CPCC 101601]|uniref:Uncharacterized protein n=1 Tax=Pseudogemmobacter lacusdianii TaxID=3069608 RepID=A0ABU0VUU7_9RHOB|nr:hypothetical protein [Xinfangfangia sp. CPCC 101601]MDQ2065512.1 hypothetical protein [Xinfangfangia sp. CPCC 101601]
MDRMLSQIVNMLLRKLVRRGVNAGINHLSRRGKSQPQPMTKAEREQANAAQGLADKARKMQRLSRRL